MEPLEPEDKIFAARKSDILKARFKSFQINYPESVGLQAMMKGREILEYDFCLILDDIPIKFLMHARFRGILQNTIGINDEIDKLLFQQSVSAAYRKLGISIF